MKFGRPLPRLPPREQRRSCLTGHVTVLGIIRLETCEELLTTDLKLLHTE